MPIPVRPDVSEDTLSLLLDEGHESETLDFKSQCDLSDNDHVLEIVKDIAAMQILGGYLVIGADSNGRPTDTLDDRQIALFDEARLRAKVRSFLPNPLQLLVRHHNLDGHQYVLIYVGAHTDGLAIIAKHGNNSKNKTVFRQGEVFARHGTSSEPWTQQDAARIWEQMVALRKESWLADSTDTLTEALAATRAAPFVAGPASVLTWELDSEAFLDTVVEQLRHDDRIPTKLFLTGIPGEVARLLVHQEATQRLEVVFDRLTCMAAIALRLEDTHLFESVIKSLVAVYDLPIVGNGDRRRDLNISPELLWFMILQRVTALGALAERLKVWGAIRFLVLQSAKDFGFERYTNWYRHALTVAAQANLLDFEKDGERIRSALLPFGLAQIERLECLRPDLSADHEELLNSLCRFDLLASLVAIDGAGATHGGVFYPNFAKFNTHRAEPAAIALIQDSKMRNALFQGDDESLARTLSVVDDTAQEESYRINGWDRFRDRRILDFLRDHGQLE